MDIPRTIIPPRFVSCMSRYATPGNVAMSGFAGDNLTPAANRTFYIPFYLPCPFDMKRIFACIGGLAAGNMDLGVFSMDGAKIVSTGSTAVAGANDPQYVTLAQMLGPGSYFFGLSGDNASQRWLDWTPGLQVCRMLGILQEAAFPLPASMTPATPASNYIPVMGITSTDSGF